MPHNIIFAFGLSKPRQQARGTCGSQWLTPALLSLHEKYSALLCLIALYSYALLCETLSFPFSRSTKRSLENLGHTDFKDLPFNY